MVDRPMSETRRVYGGLYSDPASAERGIRRFRDSGYDSDRLGIVTRDREETKELADDTGAQPLGERGAARLDSDGEQHGAWVRFRRGLDSQTAPGREWSRAADPGGGPGRFALAHAGPPPRRLVALPADPRAGDARSR